MVGEIHLIQCMFVKTKVTTRIHDYVNQHKNVFNLLKYIIDQIVTFIKALTNTLVMKFLSYDVPM